MKLTFSKVKIGRRFLYLEEITIKIPLGKLKFDTYNCVSIDGVLTYCAPTFEVELLDSCQMCEHYNIIDGDSHCMRLDIPLVYESNIIGAENIATFTCDNFTPKGKL